MGKIDLRNLEQCDEMNQSERISRRNKSTGRKATNKSYQSYEAAKRQIQGKVGSEKQNKRN